MKIFLAYLPGPADRMANSTIPLLRTDSTPGGYNDE